jgi:hypothetical protein
MLKVGPKFFLALTPNLKWALGWFWFLVPGMDNEKKKIKKKNLELLF